MNLPSHYPWTIDSKTGLAIPEINYGIDGTKLQNFAPGNGGGGTINNTMAITNDPLFGRVLQFNSSAWVSFPNHASLNISDLLFMMAWINPASYGGNNQGAIFAKKSGAVDGYQLRLANPSQLNFFTGTTGHSVNVGITLSVWQQVGVFFDNTLGLNQITYFRNGAVAGNATELVAITNNASPLFIGNGNQTTNNVPFNGMIARPFISLVPDVATATQMIKDEYARFKV